MVAYSFKQQFRLPILAGIKQQTIRADRKRHARRTEEVQLYTGMRTRLCCIIGRSVCTSVSPIRIGVDAGWIETDQWDTDAAHELDAFAIQDGFYDWAAMQSFWLEHHPGVPVFSGVLIQWGDLL